MADDELTDLGARVLEHFRRVHSRVFMGDPVSNPKLKVDVLGEAVAHDTPSLVLITPWMLNGLAFPPDGALPETLTINGRAYPVFLADIEGIGLTHSINLVAAVETMTSHAAARSAALALAGPFHEALARAREVEQVADPGRRRLLRLDIDRA